MRLPLVLLTALLFTPTLGGLVVLAALVGVPDRPNGVYDWAARSWTRLLCWAAGVRIVLHNPERMHAGTSRVFASNHVSWYDVFVLASVVPFSKFVAKAELFRIPIFGRAARAVGTVPIERENRKAAFGAYDVAAARMRAGSSVVVFPEGTRGASYRMRPFKKGPFVLAIAAGAPIVPTIVHGTIAVMPRGSWYLTPGRVDVHFLEPVLTTGLTYADRDTVSREVWRRMAEAFRTLYHVESDALAPGAQAAAAG